MKRVSFACLAERTEDGKTVYGTVSVARRVDSVARLSVEQSSLHPLPSVYNFLLTSVTVVAAHTFLNYDPSLAPIISKCLSDFRAASVGLLVLTSIKKVDKT